MIYIPTKQGQRKMALSVTLELRACVMMSFHERASLIDSFIRAKGVPYVPVREYLNL